MATPVPTVYPIHPNLQVREKLITDNYVHVFQLPSEMVLPSTETAVVVMVEGPAVGKAGDDLDWIARGLERKNKLGDFGNPYPLWTGAPYI